jgi:hypothetical protein
MRNRSQAAKWQRQWLTRSFFTLIGRPSPW